MIDLILNDIWLFFSAVSVATILGSAHLKGCRHSLAEGETPRSCRNPFKCADSIIAMLANSVNTFFNIVFSSFVN